MSILPLSLHCSEQKTQCPICASNLQLILLIDKLLRCDGQNVFQCEQLWHRKIIISTVCPTTVSNFLNVSFISWKICIDRLTWFSFQTYDVQHGHTLLTHTFSHLVIWFNMGVGQFYSRSLWHKFFRNFSICSTLFTIYWILSCDSGHGSSEHVTYENRHLTNNAMFNMKSCVNFVEISTIFSSNFNEYFYKKFQTFQKEFQKY